MADKARALQTFFAGRRIVHEGDELDRDDPIIKGREGLFDIPAPAKKAAPKKAAASKKGTA